MRSLELLIYGNTHEKLDEHCDWKTIYRKSILLQVLSVAIECIFSTL
jgi:hypothetical protein